MNPILDKIKARRSIRKFTPDMPEKEDLEKIIEAGLYAASGMWKQSPIIVAVTNKELRDLLSEMNHKIGGGLEGFDPFYGAPVVLIALADKSSHLCLRRQFGHGQSDAGSPRAGAGEHLDSPRQAGIRVQRGPGNPEGARR